MHMGQIGSFNALIQKSIIDNWDRDALTDFKGQTLQFHDVARKIEKLHILFENSGIQKGDKIALCGRNPIQSTLSYQFCPHCITDKRRIHIQIILHCSE